jgi:hypothetical protein
MEASGLDTTACAADEDVRSCTVRVGQSAVAYQTYTTFYSHVDSLCFFMKREHFQRSTEDAINTLFAAALHSTRMFQDIDASVGRVGDRIAEGHERVSSRLAELGAQEQARFASLAAGVDRVGEGVGRVGAGLEGLRQGHAQLEAAVSSSRSAAEEVLSVAGATHEVAVAVAARQREAEARLGRLGQGLQELGDAQASALSAARAGVEDLGSRTAAGFSRMLESQATVSARVHDAGARLAEVQALSAELAAVQGGLLAQAAALAGQLHDTRAYLGGLLRSAVASLRDLRIDLLAITAALFYPALALLIFPVTSIPRTAAARGPLLLLLAAGLLLEHALHPVRAPLALLAAHSAAVSVYCTARGAAEAAWRGTQQQQQWTPAALAVAASDPLCIGAPSPPAPGPAEGAAQALADAVSALVDALDAGPGNEATPRAAAAAAVLRSTAAWGRAPASEAAVDASPEVHSSRVEFLRQLLAWLMACVLGGAAVRYRDPLRGLCAEVDAVRRAQEQQDALLRQLLGMLVQTQQQQHGPPALPQSPLAHAAAPVAALTPPRSPPAHLSPPQSPVGLPQPPLPVAPQAPPKADPRAAADTASEAAVWVVPSPRAPRASRAPAEADPSPADCTTDGEDDSDVFTAAGAMRLRTRAAKPKPRKQEAAPATGRTRARRGGAGLDAEAGAQPVEDDAGTRWEGGRRRSARKSESVNRYMR